jgi:ABC-2 type transport system permease protein/ribosome-dependent ATPase
LNAGHVRVVLVIGEHFEARLLAGRTATVQSLINGTLINTTRVLKGYIEAINAAAGLALQTTYVARRIGVTEERAETLMSPVRLEPRYLYNQEMRTIWAIAPSSIMNIMMWTSPLLMALSVVREKERGSIFNVYASATTRLEFLVGKLLPCAGISFVNAMALWAIATWYFGAPFKGSPGTFVIAAAVFAVATSTFGLLVSLWVRTQQSALMIAVIAGSVIAMQFSGMFEAVNTLPPANRTIAHLFPAMYFNNVVLGTFLKGHGLADSWSDIAMIGLFAGLYGALSHISFHKRVTR